MEMNIYQIEEVAKRTGLTKRAIRYYEDIELIKPIRTNSQYRLYSEEDIEKITRIRTYKDSLGFSLNEVKDIFDLELVIKSLSNGEVQHNDKIETSIAAIEHQIQLIEIKEETMEKVKKRYLEILQDLKNKYDLNKR
jgi:Predicted transcriptional regulators